MLAAGDGAWRQDKNSSFSTEIQTHEEMRNRARGPSRPSGLGRSQTTSREGTTHLTQSTARLDRARIAALTAGPIPDDDLITADDQVIGRVKDYTVVYAPFGVKPRPKARVIFVGLTPGRQQLAIAMEVAREKGTLDPEVLAIELRRRVAFAGQMRTNLVRMLDDLRLPKHLDIQSTCDLFDSAQDRLFATSALLYPVFLRGRNYSGDPAILREPLFIEMLESLLGPTLQGMPKAVIIPFGRWAEAAVLYLAERGFVDPARVLKGLPHPSGANAHRPALFAQNAASMRRQLSRWFRQTGEA